MSKRASLLVLMGVQSALLLPFFGCSTSSSEDKTIAQQSEGEIKAMEEMKQEMKRREKEIQINKWEDRLKQPRDREELLHEKMREEEQRIEQHFEEGRREREREEKRLEEKKIEGELRGYP